MSRNKVGVPFQVPTRYVGPGRDIIPIVKISREPLNTDVKYPLGQFWLIGDAPTTGSVGELFYLCDFVAGVPTWCQLSTGSGGSGVESLSGSTPTTINPTGAGNIAILSATVANATNAIPLYVDDGTIEQLTIEVQVAVGLGGAPADKNDAGLASFDNRQFTVDAEGFVIIKGAAGIAVLQTLTGDDASARSPDAAGNIDITGLTVANATHAKPVYVNGAASALVVDVQVGAAVTGAPADKLDSGLSSYDDTQFAVSTHGYVTMKGGAGLPALQTLTGDDAVATGPDASGNIDITGLAVANATNAKPLYFNGGTNAEVAEIQVATAVAAAPGDKNDAGICSFDNSAFSVDADGWVQSLQGNALGVFRMYDDFMHAFGSANLVGKEKNGKLYWQSGGAGIIGQSAAAIAAGHPGVWEVVNDSNANQHISLWKSSAAADGGLVLGGGVITIHWVYKIKALSTASNDYTLRVGLTDSGNVQPSTDGLWFQYSHDLNSGNYQIVSSAASSVTTANSNDAASTNWVRATIVINAGATSVAYFIDGVEVANSPITTNIPTVGLTPTLQIEAHEGTTGTVYVDLMYLQQVLTSSR